MVSPPRDPELISTIILNWNRVNTLRTTVESYLETVTGDFELFIVDNASTDQSRQYLAELQQTNRARVVLLDENVGGLAYNHVIPLTSGGLVHLSENDQLFLPGWSEHVRDSFRVFADLGQLSLFADVPTDDEAWGPKPSQIRFKHGRILYEAKYNVGTSSICRSEVFFEHGVRVDNVEGLDYKFPADGKLSADIKAAGYWCAWSDRYHVRNLGHEVDEYEADPDYYRGNYASKPWLGIEGWQERIAAQRAQPKVLRQSAVFPTRHAVPEKSELNVGSLAARTWSMFDTKSPEIEVIDFIFSLVRLVKPQRAIVMPAWIGLTTTSIGLAMKNNGIGEVVAVESDPDVHETTRANLVHYGVADRVRALLGETVLETHGPFDFAVLDGVKQDLVGTLGALLPRLNEGAYVVIVRELGSTDDVLALLEQARLRVIPLGTPRGCFIGRKQ